MTSETKVGVFFVLGIFLLGLSVYLLGNFSFSRGYALNVKFEDVSGLPKKSSVRLNGVEVGKVKEIKMEGGQVVVVVSIHHGTEIYKDASFKIAATSIIGSKFLRVDQGSIKSGLLAPGDYVSGVTVPPMEDMIADAMGTINNFVSEFDNGAMGNDLHATLVNVRNLSANLNELVNSLKPYLASSAGNINEMTGEMNALLSSLQKQEGILGALLNDPLMKDDIKTSITNLKEVTEDAKNLIGKANHFRIFWDFDAYYDTKAKFMQNDFGLNIFSPNGYTYYRIALANVGNKDNTPKDGDYTDTNLLDARMGVYNGYFDISAGMVRGAGGAALGFTPFYGKQFLDRLTLRVSGSDFSRNRSINGYKFDRANLWYGADLRLNKYITIGGGMMDALETNHPYAKIQLQLEDKDIASFFGLATLAKP